MARLIQDETPQPGRYVRPETEADSNPPLLAPNAQFRMIHHPTKWCVVEGYDDPLPQLDKLALSPGVNHVGKEGIKMALRIAEAEGATVIPLDAGGYPSYLRAVKVRAGECYVHVCERTYAGSATITPSPEYWAWCAALVAEGVIAPPPEHIALAHLAEAEANLARWQDLAQQQPSAAAGVVIAKHRFNVWNKYLNPPVQAPAKGKA